MAQRRTKAELFGEDPDVTLGITSRMPELGRLFDAAPPSPAPGPPPAPLPAPLPVPDVGEGAEEAPGFRGTTTPREQETIPAPVRRAPSPALARQEPAPEPPQALAPEMRDMPVRRPPEVSETQATIPAPPAISSAASTTRTPDISAPAAISGGLTRIAPTEPTMGALEPAPNPLAPGGVSRRAPSFLGGRRSLSPMFGREGGLMGGGLGVSNLISGETPDDLSVLKLLQALLSQG